MGGTIVVASCQRTAGREQLSIATTSAVILGSGVLSSIVAARVLGPDDRGLLVAWQVWALAIGTLASFGLPQVAVTMRDVRWGQIWTTQVVGATIGALLASLVVHALSAGPPAVVGAAFLALGTGLNGSQAAWHQRSGHLMWRFNTQRLTPSLGLLLSTLILALSPLRDPEIWLLVISATQLSATVMVGLVHGLGPRIEWSGLNLPVLRQAVATTPISWLSYIQYRADILLASLLLTPAQVAFYSIASAVEGAIFALGQTFGMRWFSQHRSAPVRRAAMTTFASTGIAATAFAFLSGPLIVLAYGDEFAGATPTALILCFAAVPRALDYLFTHVAIARGRIVRVSILKALGITGLTMAAIWISTEGATAAKLAFLALLTAVVLCVAQAISLRADHRRAHS